MTSGYMDAGTGPEALSNHRWYLIAMLLCRLAAVLLHGFRVPPLAQILLAACALFLLPANMVCISAACSNSFINWGAAGQPWQALFAFLYMGTEPQDWDFAYPAFRYLITRKYLLCVFLYLVAFHLGRPAVRNALAMAADLRSVINRQSWLPKATRPYIPRLLYGTAATSGLLAMSLYQTLYFEALEDNWVMEADEHHAQATLPRLGLLLLYLIAQVCLMAGMVSALPNVLHHVGSQTLGSYVCHSYLNLIVTVAVLDNPHMAGQLSTPAYLTIVLGVPLVTQLVVGPLVQRALLAHLHLLARCATSAVGMVCGRKMEEQGARDDDHDEAGQAAGNRLEQSVSTNTGEGQEQGQVGSSSMVHADLARPVVRNQI
jgi:hypothetical protein